MIPDHAVSSKNGYESQRMEESYNDVKQRKHRDQIKAMSEEQMTAEEKKRDLYERQKQLLDTFLEHGAISQAQYDKSLGDLTEKMGVKPNGEPKV